MKFLLTTFTTSIAVGMFMTASPVLAQTPDNETPANEGVCDEVFFSTPGLYGLCVAFCEAQDVAALDEPITEADLDALESSAPSGRILAAYNRKKADADPEMPCILVEEPCPCWSAEEISEIDGFLRSGDPAEIWCPADDGRLLQIRELAASGNWVALWAGGSQHPRGGRCIYGDRRHSDNIVRRLSVESGTLTPDQADQCLSQVSSARAALCP